MAWQVKSIGDSYVILSSILSGSSAESASQLGSAEYCGFDMGICAFKGELALTNDGRGLPVGGVGGK